MKVSTASWVKIAIFIIMGVVFGGVMVMYSNSQYDKPTSSNSAKDEIRSMFGSDEASTNRHIEKSFPVKKGGNFFLDTDAGEVDVVTWDKDEVQVKVDIAGSDRRSENFDVKFTADNDRVSVSGKVNDNSFFKWDVGDLDVHYVVTLPKKFSVKATTSGGNMSVRGLDGSVRLETSGGNMSINAVEGDVTLNTSGGNIEAKEVKGSLKGETSGGNVRADNVLGDVNVQTSGGEISLTSIDGSVHAETSGGGIMLKLNGENKGIDVHSSGGDINIFVNESIAANLEASTSGGRVRCELPITVKGDMSDEELRGKINGGGNVIRAETSGGDVRIKNLK